jgi:methionine sulfoxide reductase heme-binding subunit
VSLVAASPAWYLARGTGIVSLLLLTATLVVGIATATRWRSRLWPSFLVTNLHRNLTLLALAFLSVHIGASVVDS